MLVEIEGKRNVLLEYERVGLNLLQRMSGIATASRSLQDRLFRRNSAALIVGRGKRRGDSSISALSTWVEWARTGWDSGMRF